MILPSDSDPPPEKNDGDDPTVEPGEWWEDHDDPEAEGDEAADDLDEEPDDFEDPNAPQLQSVAGPGWRQDLFNDLMESLRDLEAIEDPNDEFSPPEPPDLYTFFGELAALRHEFRDHGQRTQQALNQLMKSLPGDAPAPSASSIRRRKKEAPASELAAPGSWPVEWCLALINLRDLLPLSISTAAFETSLQPLFQAAGITRIPTLGLPFDPGTMIKAGAEPAPKKSAAGTVLREIAPGYLRQGVPLRPATVITAS